LTMVNESKKGVLEKVRSEPISTKEPSQTLIQKTSYTDSICGMEFVLVNGRKFQMGDVFGDGQPHEKPVHDVLVSSFYMGRYEVKIREFKKFVGATGYKTEAEKGGGIYGYTGSKWELQAGKNWRDIGFPQTDDHPVVGVSYNDVMEYIRWLNMQSGKRYRLPTEAEWEYAARSGGNQEKWAGTNNESEVAEYAWYSNNSGREIHPVGQKKANGLGLYDMTGNVWEWIQDWFDEHYYKSSPEKNPTGPNSGEYRVIRGGSWGNIPKNIRASHRTRVVPQERSNSIGFRMVLSLQ
jgi:formylglycine-generating enzyme required for sulfatase activity